MRSLLATLLLMAISLSACQTQPGQREKELQAQIDSLQAERRSQEYLGKLETAVEGWRKAMNAALGKYAQELAATRLESQQQVTTMAGSLEAMARTLAEQKAAQESYLAKIEKDSVQAKKTLEELQRARSTARLDEQAAKLEREKVTALLETIQRGRDEDQRKRDQDRLADRETRRKADESAKSARVELSSRLEKLAKTSTAQIDLVLSLLERYRKGLDGLELGQSSLTKQLDALEKANAESRDPQAQVRLEGGLAAVKKAVAQDQEAAAKAREKGRQERQDLEARLDALGAVTEKSFARLDKQLTKLVERLEQDAAARKSRIQKSALPGKATRDPDHLLSQDEPFWQNPFIAIPGAFLLLVLLFFLLKRSPEEARMDRREAPVRQEQEALEAMQVSETSRRTAEEPVPPIQPGPGTASRTEPRMPMPSSRDVDSAPRDGEPQALPRPRCVSLRIPGDELGEAAEVILQERLARDPRILVEPRPRLERRGDGSLSARFYSVGGLADAEVEALSRSLRSLAAQR